VNISTASILFEVPTLQEMHPVPKTVLKSNGKGKVKESKDRKRKGESEFFDVAGRC
jgi:hypothetical protein